MMNKLILLLIIVFSITVRAQFDDDGGSSDFGDEFKEESSEPKKSNKKEDDGFNGFEEKSQPNDVKDEFVKGDVTNDDLKKLSDAKRMKSEPALVTAAAEILSKDPNHLETLNLMGVFYFEQKKFGLAKILLRRAMKAHPNQAALYNNLGIIYLAENDLPLALDAFKKSLSADSGYKTGATNLSSIYLEYGDYQRSLAPLESAYRALRSDIGRGANGAVEVANNYAVALMGIGENSKAGKVFEEIDEAGVRNPTPFLNYAILLVEVQKKKKDAIRIISKLKFMTEDREILRRVQELENKME